MNNARASVPILLGAASALLALASSCSNPVATEGAGRYVTTGYTLKWSDEFNTGSAPDPGKWGYDIGNGTNGWGNNELEYYTNRPANVQVAGGNLVITSLKENYNGFGYTSARLTTKGLYSFTHGKIVASIKLSSGNRAGIWPAFWMLGANIDTVGWPRCGEIDVMENKGANTVYSTLHWWNDQTASSTSYGTSTAATINGYHDYEVEWTSTQVIARIDGVTYMTRSLDSTMAEFNGPFYILLNQAVGGKFSGNPKPTTLFPSTMYVDYIRVYQ